MKHALEKLLDSYKSRGNESGTFKVHRDIMNGLTNREEYAYMRLELLELEQLFKDRVSVKIVRSKIVDILGLV